ncbi:hypothetical protein [Agromyces bauzanensis]
MTTSTPRRALSVGDKVTIAPGLFPASVSTTQVFEITKVPTRANEVNYVASPVDGGRGVRAQAFAFIPFEGEAEAPEVAGRREFAVPLTMGTVVTVTHPQFNPDDLYVVLAAARDGGNRLTRLGGENDRYWKSIPTGLCTVVDPRGLSHR